MKTIILKRNILSECSKIKPPNKRKALKFSCSSTIASFSCDKIPVLVLFPAHRTLCFLFCWNAFVCSVRIHDNHPRDGHLGVRTDRKRGCIRLKQGKPSSGRLDSWYLYHTLPITGDWGCCGDSAFPLRPDLEGWANESSEQRLRPWKINPLTKARWHGLWEPKIKKPWFKAKDRKIPKEDVSPIGVSLVVLEVIHFYIH